MRTAQWIVTAAVLQGIPKHPSLQIGFIFCGRRSSIHLHRLSVGSSRRRLVPCRITKAWKTMAPEPQRAAAAVRGPGEGGFAVLG